MMDRRSEQPGGGGPSPSYWAEELFRSTAPYYARYRSGYPMELFRHLARRLALDGTQRVLDLGCGTGHVAVPLAEYVAGVIAVDPEPMMLAEGRTLAAGRSVGNIDWRLGDSTRLHELSLAGLDLVTMGASFHWMERRAVLRALDRMVKAEGAVVLVGASTQSQSPPWAETASWVRARWLGPERRAGSGVYVHPRERHEDVLCRSAFSHVETATWMHTIVRDLDSVVGLQFSFSFCAHAPLGGGKKAFERELRAALVEANPSGVFSEVVRTEAIIAARPRNERRLGSHSERAQ